METCTKVYLQIPQDVIDGKCRLPIGFFERQGIVNGSKIAKRVITMLAIYQIVFPRSKEQAKYETAVWDTLQEELEASREKKAVCTETEEELQAELEVLEKERGDEIAIALERMYTLD